jgi:hypothetical protein
MTFPIVDNGGEAVTTDGVIDESFLMRYRVLLDEEAAAFDELEHAYEDGDRDHFRADLRVWEAAVNRKLAYLSRNGMTSITLSA